MAIYTIYEDSPLAIQTFRSIIMPVEMKNVAGFKYPLMMATAAEFAAEGPVGQEYIAALVQAGGIFATVSSAGPVVAGLVDILGCLSDEEQIALYYHEEGHFEAGDFDAAMSGSVVSKDIDGTSCKMLDDITIELAADAYAASKTSKAVVKSAIENMIISMLSYHGQPEKFQEVLQHKDIAPRLEALSE